MKLFTFSPACRSRAHCGRCRDLDGGRAFRVNLGVRYALPVDAPDFACPHGRVWGSPGPSPANLPPPMPIPDGYVPGSEAPCCSPTPTKGP